jgi:UDP-N-acetylmuramate dehydrogenase
MALEPGFVTALQGVAAVRLDEPMSRHTTIGIGGPADAYVAVASAAQLGEVLRLCAEAGVPLFMLGSGSNIVVGDGGIRGVVVENRAQGVTSPTVPLSLRGEGETGSPSLGSVRLEDADERYLFRLDSGCSFAAEARRLAFAGYAGLEWACGIPGTLGGAVVYNAGAYGGCLGDVLRRVAVWDAVAVEVTYEASELGLVYRGSDFTRGLMAGRTVLWAEVALWQGDTEALSARVADYDARRLKAQPRGRNAGSFFKNPSDGPAWRLLDAVGLRGHRIGGAEFSEKHCNFLINAGGATGADVAALKSLAQERVRAEFGLELENEVTLVGEGWPPA